ncbi:MAG: hypothetical protein CVT99_00825 [Bacteroidetes bacterium HGW-Bacteroidetes-16]|jgi:PAS domain S-box-containing protein|nr:MAG: hypothetical protein CVT99_00825 [Bacteroidetes bacterium HGW-Bacteroidetes-16]
MNQAEKKYGRKYTNSNQRETVNLDGNQIHTRCWSVSVYIFFSITAIFLISNLNAVVDYFMHPDIPYFDEEHLVVGGITGLFCLVLLIIIGIYNHRLYKMARKQFAHLQRLKYLTKYANDIILLLDEDENIIEANEMAEVTYGYEASILLKMNWLDLYPKDSAEEVKNQLKQIEAQNGLVYEARHQRRDGAFFEVEISSQLLTINKKKFYQMFIRDITTRKSAEKALRESEDRYRSLFENLTIGLYRTHPDGRILMANPTTVKMMGCTSLEELMKRNLEKEGFEPDYSREQFHKVIESEGQIRGLESAWVRWDGSTIYVRESAKAIKNLEGNILYYEGSVEDITERKLAENKLRESEKRLTELNATKDKFFSIIAHDLRSPFNSIIGFGNLLREQIQEKKYQDLEKYIQIILKSSNNAMDLLLNLLEWARSQTGGMEFKLGPIDITRLINEVTGQMEPIAQEKSITISSELSSSEIIFADRDMVKTMVRNLISNAIKYSFIGGEIRITAERKNHHLTVCVMDQGVGIKNEVQSKLFKIDECISTLGTSKEKGTGLGLMLCKEFVDKHNGKIWVESKFGRGSKFCFALPDPEPTKITFDSV